METTIQSYTVTEIAQAIGGEVLGDGSVVISEATPAGEDCPHGITFAGDAAYLDKALKSDIGAIIAPSETTSKERPLILVPNPRAAFGMVLAMLRRPLPLNSGIHPTAVISEVAEVDPTAQIGPYVVIESGAKVGARCQIYAHSYVGQGCVLGDDCTLFPRATLYQDVHLGRGCVIHSGAVLGCDGFGFVWDGTKQVKVPQIGRVELGDFCEVGANTCIDRATCGATRLGQDTKLDNLIQVGHNVQIGEHTVIAAHVGISGSSTIGSNNTIAGQVAISDHVNIGDNVILGGRSGVISDITEPGAYLGLPAIPLQQAMRAMALQGRLPEIYQRLRQVERELAALQENEDLS
ncbi:MAG: UDP-3-O-(3-hydroxymyristoyl)glucosamine N-acyltransferase [Armatimonadetes bacterium]|nr:UDP-3-O-(3-hydroxymyristoyl)glucosamine N-acyltransferase [Armatimonadota bacterium]